MQTNLQEIISTEHLLLLNKQYICNVNEENKIIDKDFFKGEFVLWMLRNGKHPITVFKFCEDLGVDETEFYKYFNSFNALEKAVWGDFFHHVHEAIAADDEYNSFTTHEKILSFYYTLFEVLKQNRSYVMLQMDDFNYRQRTPWFMNDFKKLFKGWVKDIVNEGVNRDELATRPIITDRYNEVFWFHLMYLLKVWINDESEQFVTTDAAIEKSTALLSELMKKGPIDLFIDFAKFAYQHGAY